MILKREKGITLIALVVTIITLIIISGITIGTLQNKNSIMRQAGETGDEAGKESIIEKIEADLYQEKAKTGKLPTKAELQELIKNKGYNEGELGEDSFVTKDGEYTISYQDIEGWKKGIEPGDLVSETKKNNYKDENGEYATVPAGFKVDETETTISKGLVVYGPDDSEFVWVPVPDINNMAQCSTAGGSCNLQLDGDTLKCITHNNTEIVGKLYFAITDTGIDLSDEADTTYSAESLREPGYLTDSTNGDESSDNTIGLALSDMQTDYKNMATSVAKYGGFYVGRYETSLSDATANSAGKSGKVQSKQGVMPSASSDTETRMWYGLYNKQNKKYIATNDSVESSMIWGSQYDRILNWVKEENDNEEKANLTSKELGNHSGIITTTGNSRYSNDSIKNIRDLGGNLYEWTLEAGDKMCRILRWSVSYREPGYPNFSDNETTNLLGSRMTLFVK